MSRFITQHDRSSRRAGLSRPKTGRNTITGLRPVSTLLPHSSSRRAGLFSPVRAAFQGHSDRTVQTTPPPGGGPARVRPTRSRPCGLPAHETQIRVKLQSVNGLLLLFFFSPGVIRSEGSSCASPTRAVDYIII